MTLGQEPFRNLQPACDVRIGRIGRSRCSERVDISLNRRSLTNPCAAEDDDRVPNRVLLKQQLRFELIKLKADAAYFIAVEEIHVLISLAVTRAFQDVLDSLPCFRLLCNRLGLMPW